MGNKHTLEDDLITFKLTSKQMIRSAKKCDKNVATNKSKVRQAIEANDMERARIYAANYTREKNQSLNLLRLSSRIDAVAARLETAIRMQQINEAMGQTVKGMANAMKSMEVEKIAKTMEEFEKQFEDLDVRSGYMEQAIDNSTSMTTPPEEVDSIIQMVADEARLKIDGLMDDAGTVSRNKPTAVEEAPQGDDFESRLAALRR